VDFRLEINSEGGEGNMWSVANASLCDITKAYDWLFIPRKGLFWLSKGL